MPSSDIYKVQEPPWAKKEETPPTSSRRRRSRSSESYDEVMEKDISKTNRRRNKNSGFRRLRHLLKKPDFSRKFWTIILSVAGLILVSLIIWDFFFRYPNAGPHQSNGDDYELNLDKLNRR